jgi:hypothetical protein
MVVLTLAAFFGSCMGGYAVIRTGMSEGGVTADAMMQLIASAVKLPLLFVLTLVITFPSLYVFNALLGSRLSIASVARLLVAMLGVMMAVLASLGPIVVFFAVSTTSYPFMKLLNVAMATLAGVFGLAFLRRSLHRLMMVQLGLDPAPTPPPTAIASEPEAQETTESGESSGGWATPSALDRVETPATHKATIVFQVWMVVFALVGAQTSWVLRPFIGSPDLPFSWIRQRESNFFLDVLMSLGELFGV